MRAWTAEHISISHLDDLALSDPSRIVLIVASSISRLHAGLAFIFLADLMAWDIFPQADLQSHPTPIRRPLDHRRAV